MLYHGNMEIQALVLDPSTCNGFEVISGFAPHLHIRYWNITKWAQLKKKENMLDDRYRMPWYSMLIATLYPGYSG